MKNYAFTALLASALLLLGICSPDLGFTEGSRCLAAQAKTARGKKVYKAQSKQRMLNKQQILSKQVDPVKTAKAKEMLAQGTKKFKQGSHYEAEALFKSVLCIDPNNADAFYNLGALKEHRHDLVEALSNYRAAQALRPQDKQIGEAVRSIETSMQTQGELGMQANKYDVDSATPFLGVAPDFRKQNVLTDLFPDRNPNQIPEQIPVQTSDSIAARTDDGPFRLRGEQDAINAAAATNAATRTLPVVPIVQSPAQQPVVQQTKNRPVVRAAVNQALNIGTSYALRSVGLHCPLCHVVRFRF